MAGWSSAAAANSLVEESPGLPFTRRKLKFLKQIFQP